MSEPNSDQDEEDEEESSEAEDRVNEKLKVFQVRVEKPMPEGTRLSKNKLCFV